MILLLQLFLFLFVQPTVSNLTTKKPIQEYCSYLGYSYSSGINFQPRNSPCETCYCNYGKVQCKCKGGKIPVTGDESIGPINADKEWIDLKHDRITKITVWFTKHMLVGIQLTRKVTGEGIKREAPYIESCYSCSMNLVEGDFVNKVKVYTSKKHINAIVGLEFQTIKGAKLKCGPRKSNEPGVIVVQTPGLDQKSYGRELVGVRGTYSMLHLAFIFKKENCQHGLYVKFDGFHDARWTLKRISTGHHRSFKNSFCVIDSDLIVKDACYNIEYSGNFKAGNGVIVSYQGVREASRILDQRYSKIKNGKLAFCTAPMETPLAQWMFEGNLFANEKKYNFVLIKDKPYTIGTPPGTFKGISEFTFTLWVKAGSVLPSTFIFEIPKQSVKVGIKQDSSGFCTIDDSCLRQGIAPAKYYYFMIIYRPKMKKLEIYVNKLLISVKEKVAIEPLTIHDSIQLTFNEFEPEESQLYSEILPEKNIKLLFEKGFMGDKYFYYKNQNKFFYMTLGSIILFSTVYLAYKKITDKKYDELLIDSEETPLISKQTNI